MRFSSKPYYLIALLLTVLLGCADDMDPTPKGRDGNRDSDNNRTTGPIRPGSNADNSMGARILSPPVRLGQGLQSTNLGGAAAREASFSPRVQGNRPLICMEEGGANPPRVGEPEEVARTQENLGVPTSTLANLIALGVGLPPTEFRTAATQFANKIKPSNQVYNVVRTLMVQPRNAYRFTNPREPGGRRNVAQCGNYYVAELKPGAWIRVGLKFEFRDQSDKDRFVRDFNPAASITSTGSSQNLQNMKRYLANVQAKLSVHVLQLGGNWQRSKDIFDRTQCGNQEIDKCQQTLTQLISTFRNSLSNQLRDRLAFTGGWALISLVPRAYPGPVGPPPPPGGGGGGRI